MPAAVWPIPRSKCKDPAWSCRGCNRKGGLGARMFKKHGREATYRCCVAGSVCQACGKQFWATERFCTHLRDSASCVNILRGQGKVAAAHTLERPSTSNPYGPQSATGILQKAKRHGCGGRKGVRGARPLALLWDDRGQQAKSQADHDRIWLKHFSDQEYGCTMSAPDSQRQTDAAKKLSTSLMW